MAETSPLLLRRIRAALRRFGPGRPGRIEGFVDSCVAGDIHGWAINPRQPNRRVHVIAVSDGQVVAEALANQHRADLVRDGRGDGRHAFRLRLPAALLDGERRSVQVRAMVGGKAVRLAVAARSSSNPATISRLAARVRRSERPGRGRRSPIRRRRPCRSPLAGAGQTSAPPSDWGVLGTWRPAVRLGRQGVAIADLASAHTVVFARFGDRLDPRISAVVLQQSRPLSDVITWDGLHRSLPQAGGQSLGPAAGRDPRRSVRPQGPCLRRDGESFAQALAEGDIRRAERLLAAHPALRWTHLPGRRPEGPAGDAAPGSAPSMAGLDGFRSLGRTPGRPRRPIDSKVVCRLISLAIWPRWGPGAEASLGSLLAQAPPGAAVEVLAPAAGAERARALAEAMGSGDAGNVSVRAVDTPPHGTPGAWLAALSDAASGDVWSSARPA